MEIHVDIDSDIHIVHLIGRWDAYSTAQFEGACMEYIEKGMRRMILDLADVDYISSLGLRGLLNIGKSLDPLNGTIVICTLQPHLRKLFIGSGFSSLFAEYPDLESARKALQKK